MIESQRQETGWVPEQDTLSYGSNHVDIGLAQHAHLGAVDVQHNQDFVYINLDLKYLLKKIFKLLKKVWVHQNESVPIEPGDFFRKCSVFQNRVKLWVQGSSL